MICRFKHIIWKAHCKAEAIAGITYIMEDISNEVRQIHELLSDVKRPSLDTLVEDYGNYKDGYPEHKVKFEDAQ